MAVQVGATCLERERGGKGVLLGGVPGTRRGRVAILGGGVVGRNAATIAIGMGAQVTVLDVRAETMAYLEDVFGGAIETLYSNPTHIEEVVARADLVVGAVLVAGAAAPKLVTASLVGRMEKGSVIVDVASFTTAFPTCPALCRKRAPGHSRA
jgi:alanine dehydrogenase